MRRYLEPDHARLAFTSSPEVGVVIERVTTRVPGVLRLDGRLSILEGAREYPLGQVSVTPSRQGLASIVDGSIAKVYTRPTA